MEEKRKFKITNYLWVIPLVVGLFLIVMGVLRERVSDSQMGLEDGAGFIRISTASIYTHKIYIIYVI